MTDVTRRYIVRASQGGVDDPPAEPAGDSGAGSPDTPKSGQGEPATPKAGQAQAGGAQDSGKRGSDPVDVSDQIWAKASNHYQPKIKQLETELTEYRQRYATEQAKAKSAEQLAEELESSKRTWDKRTASIAEFAQSRVTNLPDHIRDLVETAAGGDPFKTLEILPKFEDLARKTQLKTVGGNQSADGKPQIDFQKILDAQNRGDMTPLKQAIEKHGKQVYETGLREFMLTRK